MDDAPAAMLPPGEYAIVELFGHVTMVGRIAEAERFGAKMLVIEPLFQGVLLPAIFQGGSSIYRLTPCSAEIARRHSPLHDYQLPQTVRCIVPPALLEPPEPDGDSAPASYRDEHDPVE